MHELLKTLDENQKGHWPKYVGELVYYYNSTPHAATGFPPYQLLFGVLPVIPLDNYLSRDDGTVETPLVTQWVKQHV